MSINQINNNHHNYFMQLALQQAERILGNTKNNPAVGCVIVKKNCIQAAGSTGFGGRPHAETNAIQFNKKKVSNSYLYVTLEPCSHYGKTPPCINKIASNKIKKVFFSIHDADKRSFKKCKKKLKKKNILVSSGLLSQKLSEFYKSYTNYKKNGLPYVTAKIAVSKDLYTVNKKNKYITNAFSRARVHLMRSKHDCILTSSKTIIEDNSKLSCRIEGLENRSPAIIVLDKKLNIPVNSFVIKSATKHPTYIFYNKGNKEKINKLIKLKVKLIKMPLSSSQYFNLKEVLIKISKKGFSRVFLEAGLNLTNSFLSKGLVNQLILFISNKIIGKNGSNNFKNTMNLFLKNKKPISYKVNLFYDRLISYKIK